jgi:hypothetical protein
MTKSPAAHDAGRPTATHHRPAGRIGGLEEFLRYAACRAGVWFARRDEIARAWRAGVGLPEWKPTVS